MLKKSITYTNPFTDQEVTEEHYFHISKADMVEMEMEEHNYRYTAKDGQNYTGMQAKLMMIIESEDGKAILAEMKDIIRRSYGLKVGDRFVKSPEAWAEFSSSEAFSQLLFELCTDAERAGEFMNGVIPKNLADEAQNIAAAHRVADAEPEVRPVTALHQMSQGGSASPAIEAVERVADQTGAAFPKEDSPAASGEIEATLERAPRVLTQDEAQAMDSQELQAGILNGIYRLS